MGRRKSDLTPLAALTAARDLIADPERWTRSVPARAWRAPRSGHQGEWYPVAATEVLARRWCAAGALCKVAGVRAGAPGFAVLDQASVKLFGVGIGRANDDPMLTTHADILRCFDAAILAAAGERAA